MKTHAYSNSFRVCLEFVGEIYRNEYRKTAEVPAIAHLFSVAALVMQWEGSDEAVQAALLHDVLEDFDVTKADIEAKFGAKVLEYVLDCTDLPFRQRPHVSWESRKSDYLERLILNSSESLLVIAADKIDNSMAIVRDLKRSGPGIGDRTTAGLAMVTKYYSDVAEIIAPRLPDIPSFELRTSVSELVSATRNL